MNIVNTAYKRGVRSTNGAIIADSILTSIDNQFIPFNKSNDAYNFKDFVDFEDTGVFYPDPTNMDKYYMVINPFYEPLDLTIKFFVHDLAICPKTSINFGSPVELPFEKFTSHLILNMRIEWTFPATSLSGGTFRYVDNLAFNVADKISIFFDDTNLEDLNNFIMLTDKTYKLNSMRLREFNFIIGEQIEKITKVYQLASDTQTIPLSLVHLVNSNGSDGTSTVTVGADYFITTPGYALLGINLADIDSPTVAVLTGTENALDDVLSAHIQPEDIVSSETVGSIEYGYNGLQTWKETHDAFTVITPLGFWFSKHDSNALAIAATSTDNMITLRFSVREFNDLVIVQTGSISNIVNTATSATPVSIHYRVNVKNVILQNNIAQLYTDSIDGHSHLASVNKYKSDIINQQETTLSKIETPYIVKEIFFALQDRRHISAKNYSAYCAYQNDTIAPLEYEVPVYEQLKYSIGATETDTILYEGDDIMYSVILPMFYQDFNNNINSRIGLIPFTDSPNSIQTLSYINFTGGIDSYFNIKLNTAVYGSSGYTIDFKAVFKTVIPIIYQRLRIKMAYLKV